MVLTETQRKRIQAAFESQNLNLDLEVDVLVSQGFSKEDAILQIKTEANAYRQKLFDQKINEEKKEDYTKIAMVVIVMVGLIGPVFRIDSIIWYLNACAIAGGVGYWAYKEKPIAGVVGSICAVILLPAAYNWYTAGRSSIIKIEMIIPIGLALIPSFLIGLLISNLLYPKK